jgi:hypothetical protein
VDHALRAHLVRNALRTAQMFEARRVAEVLRSHVRVGRPTSRRRPAEVAAWREVS